MAVQPMYTPSIGDFYVELTAQFVAGTDTTITVSDTSYLPSAPNTATIRMADKSALVTVKYTEKTATTLTGVTVLEGDVTGATTATYPVGSWASRPLTASDVKTIQDNITDLSVNKVDLSQVAGLASETYVNTAVAGKVDKVTGKDLSTNDYDNAAAAEVAKVANKVDKVDGKGLSTNDYTTAEKTKLSGIEAEAEVNIIGTVSVNGSPLTPVNKGVNIDISGKLDKVYTAAEDDYIIKVDPTDHIAKPMLAGTQTAAWVDVTNKPFATIGTGLTVTNNALTADTQFKFEVFTSLPTASSAYAQTIALIAKSEPGTQNIYDEYGCVEVSGAWQWELFGTTQFSLNIVQSASGITINNTALQSATSAQNGLLTATDFATFNGKQDALQYDTVPTSGSSNHLTSGSLKTAFDLKADASDLTAHTGNTNNPHGVTKAQVGLGSAEDGAQINVIESIKVNGTAQTITSKEVNITVPVITVYSVTVASSDWSGTTATKTVSGILASATAHECSPAPADMSKAVTAQMYVSAVANNTLTFTCTTAPTESITFNVMQVV